MNPLRIFLLAALVLVVFGVNNAEAEEQLWTFVPEYDHTYIDYVISPDGNYVAMMALSPNDDTTQSLYFFNKDNATPLWSKYSNSGHSNAFAGLIAIDNSNNVIYKVGNQNIVVDDMEGEQIETFSFGRDINHLEISDNYNTLAVIHGGNNDEILVVIDVLTYDVKWEYTISTKNNARYYNSTTSLSISGDGNFIAIGNGSRSSSHTAEHRNSTIFFFSSNSNEPIWTLNTYKNYISYLDISHNGGYISYISQFQHNETGDYNPGYNISTISTEPLAVLWEYNYPQNEGDSQWGQGLHISANGDKTVMITLQGFKLYNNSNGMEIADFDTLSGNEGYFIENTYIVQNLSHIFILDNNSNILSTFLDITKYGDQIETLHNAKFSNNLDYFVMGSGDYGNCNISFFRTNSNPEILELNYDSLYEGSSALFNLTAIDNDGDVLTYNWNMGDGTTSFDSSNEILYNYMDSGDYNITVIVSDGTVSVSHNYLVVVENIAPELSISYDSVGQEGQSYFFNAQTMDVPDDTVTVTWTFPDGTQIGGNFVEYLFIDDGEFLISVVAEDEDGGETIQQLTVTIENVAPVFTEFVIPSKVKQFIEVNFFVSAEDLGNDTIIYNFDFSGSQVESLNGSVPYTFNQVSNLDVRICASEEDGGETCRVAVLPITAFELPSAIAGSDMTVKPGDTVQFNGAGTSDEDGSIVLYEWDFDGDGIYELSSEENGRTTNIYNAEGEFKPTLRVTDNIGHTASSSFNLSVKEDDPETEDPETEDPETEEPETEDSGIPSISLITSLIFIGLLAIFRRK